MHPPRGSGPWRPTALALVAVAVVLAACTGQNLFQAGGVVSGSRPTVTITAPSENLTLALGSAVQVKAEATAPNGLSSAQFSGVYTEGGGAAYIARTQTFANAPFASLDTSLNPAAGQTSGTVWIIVKVTDTLGETKADSVKISIS